MTTGFKISDGTDLDAIYMAYTMGTKVAATGFKNSGGVDLADLLQPYVQGSKRAASAFKNSGGTDLSDLFQNISVPLASHLLTASATYAPNVGKYSNAGSVSPGTVNGATIDQLYTDNTNNVLWLYDYRQSGLVKRLMYSLTIDGYTYLFENASYSSGWWDSELQEGGPNSWSWPAMTDLADGVYGADFVANTASGSATVTIAKFGTASTWGFSRGVWGSLSSEVGTKLAQVYFNGTQTFIALSADGANSNLTVLNFGDTVTVTYGSTPYTFTRWGSAATGLYYYTGDCFNMGSMAGQTRALSWTA